MFCRHRFGAHRAQNAARFSRYRACLARAVRVLIEPLEARQLLATDISIISGAAGTGTLDHFLSATNGTISTAQDPGDTSATLSTGALTQVGSTISISINATTNIVFQDIGSVVLKTGSSSSAGFGAGNGSISFNNTANTLSTSGGDLFFGAGTSVTAANMNAGDSGFSITAGMSATGAIAVNAITAATVNLDSQNSSISSIGSTPITASGELAMSAATGITVNTSAAQLQVTNSSSGNIFITQVATPALALATAGTGVINSASSGTINITNLGSTLTVASGAPIKSTNGSITLSATDLTIGASVNSGTAHTTLGSSVAGTPIDIGTANVPGSIGLTQAYLNNITSGGLQIGTPTAGTINISQPISVNSLTLENNASITESSSPGIGTLTSSNLTINSTGPVSLTNTTTATTLTINSTGAIVVNQVNGTTVNLSSFSGSISSSAANPIAASGQLTLSAADGITVNTSTAKLQATNSSAGNIFITQLASPALALTTAGSGIVNDASSGIIDFANLGSAVTVASGAPLTSANGAITLLGTDLTISASVNSGTAGTTLGNSVAGTPINLGTANVTGSIGLTQAYLNNVTANVLRIGTATAGAITVSQSISRGTLSLINNGSITETTSPATGSLSVTSLRVSSTGPVTLSNANNVANLGASTSGAFTMNNGANAVNIPSSGVDGSAGISTSNAAITVTTTGSGLTALGPISAGSGTITMTAGGSITVDVVQGGSVSLTSSSGAIDSAGSNPIAASGQLSMNAATGITVNTSAAKLQATNSTSGNINITQVASPAQALTTAGTGVVNNASGGIIDITNLASTVTVASGAPITTNNGTITLLATDLTIAGLINSGTASTTLGNALIGTPINLGTANVLNSMGITQADLNNITAGVLRIGTATAGAITVSAPITKGSLSLVNNGSITETIGSGSLAVTNLRISSTGPVTLSPANSVANLGASVTNAFTMNNGTHSLNLPGSGVDGAQSITTSNAVITITTTGTMTVPAGVQIQNLTFVGGTLVDNGTVAESLTGLSLGNMTGSGTLAISGGSTVATSITVATVSLSGTGALQLAPNSATSRVTTLTFASSPIAWTGTLDLTNNKLIVEATALTKSTVLSTLQNQVANAQAHGTGIIDSTRPANMGLAVVDNAVTNFATFGGVAADGNSILLSQELLGDANLDGHVDLTDLSTVLNNFGTAAVAWTSGNFDGASTIDLTDLSDVLNNFGASNADAHIAPLTASATGTAPRVSSSSSSPSISNTASPHKGARGARHALHLSKRKLKSRGVGK